MHSFLDVLLIQTCKLVVDVIPYYFQERVGIHVYHVAIFVLHKLL